MSYPSLLVTADEMERQALIVRDQAYRHLFRSRRLARGDRVRAVDGRGNAIWTRVESVTAEEARLVAEGPAPSNECAVRLEVWVGVPRPSRATWLVEKATELGVAAVCWLDCERGGRRIHDRGLERLERVARAAVGQCHRSWVPRISGPHEWSELLEALDETTPAWVLQPGGPRVIPVARAGRSILIIGPEGGLSASEEAALAECAVRPLGLGPRVLRVETALVAGATLCLAGAGLEGPREGL